MHFKLSPTQQKIVNLLKEYDGYIVKSKFYNHNEVNSKLPIPGLDFEYYCLMQFTRPTFDVLEQNDIIEHVPGEHLYIYRLVT